MDIAAIQLTKSADDDLELHMVIICTLPCLSKVICRNQHSWMPPFFFVASFKYWSNVSNPTCTKLIDNSNWFKSH